MSLIPAASRPSAVNCAFISTIAGAGLVATMLGVSDRAIGYLGFGAAVSAGTSLALAVPMRAGRSWARIGLVLCALFGVLFAPAVANGIARSAVAMPLGVVLIGVWAAVVGLLARRDVRDYVERRGMRG